MNPAFWKRPRSLIFFTLVLILVVPLVFSPRYWAALVARSASGAWLLVFEKTWAGILILAAVWALGIWQTHREKWKEHCRLEFQKVIAALKVPGGLFVCVFLVHLFGVTPARMNSELAGENARLSRQQTPLPVNVAVTTEDAQARKDLVLARQELTDARQQIAQLQASTSKTRRLTEADRTAVAECLAAPKITGKIKLQPAITDSDAVEYADELERLFVAAGFAVTNFAGTIASDSVFSWGFTGERIFLNDASRPPPHAPLVQKCFVNIGRIMRAQTDSSVETNTIVIAIGGRP